jgi:hypothetical protein
MLLTSSSRGTPSSGMAFIVIIRRRLVTDNVIIGYKKFFDKGFQKGVGGFQKIAIHSCVLVLLHITRSPT